MSCSWYRCSTPTPEKEEFCTLHKKAMGIEKPKKESKPINKVSDKEKERKKELKKLYPIFLAEKKFLCEIKSPECTKTATCVHHKKGRGKNEVLDVDTFMASCSNCNLYCETHDGWARERGFKLNIHSNND